MYLNFFLYIQAKPLNYCIEHFEDLINSAEYVKLWLEMNSDTCIVYQLDRTDQKPTNNPSLTALRLRVGMSHMNTCHRIY